MKRMKTWFMDRPLNVKICIAAYTLVLAVFSVLISVLIHSAEDDMRTEQIQATDQAVSYAMILVEKEQSYLLGMATHYSINSEVQNMMRAANRGETVEELSSDITSVIQSRMYLLSLTLYDLSGRAISHVSIDGSWGPVSQEPSDTSHPFGRLVGKRRVYEWEYIPKGASTYLTQDNSPKLCLWYVVKDNNTYLPIGVIAITLDARKLLTTQTEVRPFYYTVLVVSDDAMLVDSKGPLQGELIEEDWRALLEHTPTYVSLGNFDINIEGTPYYVSYGKIRETPCKIYIIVNAESDWTNGSALWSSGIFGIVVCILLLLPLLAISAKFITHPLKLLADGMYRFAEGKRDVRVNFTGKDEIGQLGQIFNEMVEKNQKLVEETYELTVRRQAAELAALQAQVDPHFIHNMLNIIQWTAIDEGKDELAKMVHSVGTVIRFNLNRGYDFVTVYQEIELLNCYCNLQKIRLKEKLNWELDVSPNAFGAYIPKLIIQPLVENSIVHGMPDSDAGIHIHVQVSLEGGTFIRIKVTDNGTGIPPAILSELPDGNVADVAPVKRSSNRLALKNISERLNLYYGKGAYVFDIKSKLSAGTGIVIQVPYRTTMPTPEYQLELGKRTT